AQRGRTPSCAPAERDQPMTIAIARRGATAARISAVQHPRAHGDCALEIPDASLTIVAAMIHLLRYYRHPRATRAGPQGPTSSHGASPSPNTVSLGGFLFDPSADRRPRPAPATS